MSSIVYVLTNEAMPGMVKIGMTSGDNPQARMSGLYSTGVPQQFECAIAIKIADDELGPKLEGALHKAFEPDRVNPDREFFRTESERVKAILEIWPNCEDVTPQANPDDVDQQPQQGGRRPNLNFKDMGIPVDSILVSTDDENETAVVAGERTVRFRGEEMYLSRATKLVLGVNFVPFVRSHWTYEGRNLDEIYEETYPKS